MGGMAARTVDRYGSPPATICSSTRRSAMGSPGATVIPPLPAWTNSGSPPIRLATTGRPAAKASWTTSGATSGQIRRYDDHIQSTQDSRQFGPGVRTHEAYVGGTLRLVAQLLLVGSGPFLRAAVDGQAGAPAKFGRKKRIEQHVNTLDRNNLTDIAKANGAIWRAQRVALQPVEVVPVVGHFD